MKILWMSNIRVDCDIKSSGTWVYSIFHNIIKEDEISHVTNITIGEASIVQKIENAKFTQYLVPSDWIVNKTFNKKFKKFIDQVTSQAYDLIHIWGLELPWALYVEDIKHIPVLLEIQGFKGITSKSVHFNGALHRLPRNILGLFEWLFPSYSLKCIRRSMSKWERVEKKVLENATFIDVQSEWVKDVLKFKYDCNAKLYNTDIILRDSFLNCNTWDKHQRNSRKTLFVTTASTPYKGLHIAIEALNLLKNKFPDIQIRIAGFKISNRNRLAYGYLNYIYKLINNLNLNENVTFLGRLNDAELCKELQECDVFVNPTFIETYCVALAEAMAVGTPSVSSYVAALPELFADGRGLSFPVGDSISCASAIERLLNHNDLCLDISKKSSLFMRNNSNPKSITNNQIQIYKDIISISHKTISL